MADNPISAEVGLDAADLKAGIYEINRSMRVLESSFKASAASLGDWSKDATAMEGRISFLNKAIDLQKDKVAKLTAQKELMAREGKLTAAAEADMAIKINRATESLNKMQRELGQDEKQLLEMKKESDQAGKSVETLGKKSQAATGGLLSLKSVASGLFSALKAGVAMVAGLTLAMAGLALAIGKMVFSTASAVDALNDLSVKTGISTTRLQEMNYAATLLGSSQDTIVSSLARLTRGMSAANEQSADFIKKQNDSRAAIGKLVTEYANAVGEFGVNSDQAGAALERLHAAQLASTELTQGDMAAAFKTLGVSITGAGGALRDNEAVFADALDALGKVANETERDALAMQIFGKSAQELNPLIKAGSGAIADLSAKAHEVGAVMSDEDVQAFAKFQDTLESLKLGLQGTLGTLSAAFLPGFQAVFDQAGIYLKDFAAIVKGSDGDIGKMVTGVTGLIGRIVTDIAAQAPALLKSGMDILLTIVKSIITSLPVILPAAVEILISLVTFLVDNLPMLVETGINVLIALINGITTALPKLIPAMILAIELIVNVLAKNAPVLIDAAGKLIGAIVGGIIVNLPSILVAAYKILKVIYDTIGPVAMFKLAGSLIEGFIAGWNANWANMVANVGANFTALMAYIRGLLGIASPSKLSAGWGQNLALGFGRGFDDRFAGVRRQMESAVGALTLSPSLSLAGGGSSSRSLTLNMSIGGGSMSQIRKEIADSEQAVLTEVANALRRMQ